MKKGFTVIEMVVIMGMVAVLGGLTFSMFQRVSGSNKTIGCQAQLHALYEAVKMYSIDEKGYPPYDPDVYQGYPGLWATFTYGERTSIQDCNGNGLNIPAGESTYGIKIAPFVGETGFEVPPDARYLRGVKTLKCPASRVHGWKHPGEPSYLNDKWNSYQQKVDGEYTYHPYRLPPLTYGMEPTDPYYYRQLTPRIYDANGNVQVKTLFPHEDTIITWCSNHREFNGGKFDNVLFLDGSVQQISVEQDCFPGDPKLKGWKRYPIEGCGKP